MSKSRSFRMFTPEELKTIKAHSGKVSLLELSKVLEINYSNLSTALKQHKIKFIPYRKITRAKKESPAMTKKKNDEGEMLLTDDMAKSWF